MENGFKVETNMFNNIEHYYDVAVEVTTNSVTGEQSIGWTPMDSALCKHWIEQDSAYLQEFEDYEKVED